jgi:hypothetical protein
MAVTLGSTGVIFPSGSIQTSASTAYKDIAVMNSYYPREDPKFTIQNNVWTKLRFGSLLQDAAIYGPAEFDPTPSNSSWRIKKDGYYSFDVGLSILHQNYLTPDPLYGISKLIIAFTRNSGASEMENGWFVYDGSYSAPDDRPWYPYPVWMAKDCNFNTYCNVNDEIHVWAYTETAFPGSYYGLCFVSAFVFSGHMLSS